MGRAEETTGLPLSGTLVWRARLTWFALLVERLAPPLLPLLLIPALFIALAWLGLFEWLEAPLRAGLGLITLAMLAWSARPLLRLRLPTAEEVARRLDASKPEAHRPLETLADHNAAPADPIASALWREHSRRAEKAALALEAKAGDARLRIADPFALRALVTMGLLAGAFVAGDYRTDRLAFALDWTSARTPLTPPRVDIWLDPPAYTGRPPIFLTQEGSPVEGPIRAPVGSILSVRVSGGREGKPVALVLEHGAGLGPPPEPPKPPEGKAPASQPSSSNLSSSSSQSSSSMTLEQRRLGADVDLVVRRERREIARFALKAIPDLAPEALLKDALPQAASPDRQTSAGLRLSYEIKDDYGIAKAEVQMDPGAARTLYPAPETGLPLRLGPGEVLVPTEDHPWAGASVTLKLSVEDDIGQKGVSEMRKLILPARPFSNPLARALVEQRRALVFSPDDRAGVLLALDALLFAPEKFTPNAGDFVALTAIRAGIRKARDDERLREIAQTMYDYARYLEDGELSEAEKRLREAEARLRDAIERNAPPEEINRLAQEMRRAMDNYLRDLAKRSEQDPNARNGKADPNEKTISQRDLSDMLKKIEEAMKRGDTAEAQRLLNELRETLKNLRSARRQSDPAARERGEQMRELEQLQREQRDLKDRTFREGRDQKNGERGNEGSLAEQQQALRDRLKKLRERMQGDKGQGEKGQSEKGQGGKGSGLEEADEGMGDAQGKLGQGKPGDATEGQQKALEGMGRAAEGLQREMERQMGQGDPGGEDGEGLGDQPAPGHRGRAENRTDPLGRPQAREGRNAEDNSGVEVPDKDALQGSIAERAERVLRELRKRLGEFERPQDELDYLERLLRRQQ